MAQEEILNFNSFRGLRNDVDQKQVPFDFFYDLKNFNYPETGLLGFEKILMPLQINRIGTSQIDGQFEYKYLDESNVFHTENIAVTNGKIYKDSLAITPALLKDGLTAGLVSFALYQDKLFMANGKNYVQVYWGAQGVVSEMGAPAAVVGTGGNVDIGTHYYSMTYVQNGGEEILGSVSNTIVISGSTSKVNLYLPTGYSGTVSRNIYRTEAGGSTLYLLTSIPDNTALTYLDDTPDNFLGVQIPDVNNELPKPYHLAVANSALYGTVTSLCPTQVYRTETAIEVWNLARYIDVGGYGNDNTPVAGIGIDFGNIMVGTNKNWYLLNFDSTTGLSDVVPTRVNVGCKSGYTVKTVPSFGDFPGGMMFVSNQNDVRLLTGINAMPISTTVNNIRTDNIAQNIMGSLNTAFESYTHIYAEFYRNKYHLIIDDIKYVFDTRTNGWTVHDIRTTTYHSQPRCLAVINNLLYNGQPDGYIEREYYGITYRGENVAAYVESPMITVSDKYKQARKLIWWFIPSSAASLSVLVTTDSNSYFSTNATFTFSSGYFNSTYFNSTYFNVSSAEMDYRVFNINKPCRWLKYKLTVNSGNISLQNISAVGEVLRSKQEGILNTKKDVQAIYIQ